MTTGLESLLKTARSGVESVAAEALYNARGLAIPFGALGAVGGFIRPGEDSDGHARSHLGGALRRGAIGAGIGAGIGALGTGIAGYAPHDDLHDVAPFLRNVRTKTEAKRRYRAAARQSHPDVGGSHEAMQGVNAAWEAAKAHPDFHNLKVAHQRGARAAWAKFLP